MCGICGYVGDHRPELLEAMCARMVHRGPDDQGVWFDERAEVGLGHRRLSIIDTSPAGHQPMPNADETIWLSYNGEIYNFLEHRKDLESKGYRFRGNSDSEVLLYLYEEYGIEFLKKLNGIFALAIWDGKKRRLLLARDHVGIKPLYYWQDGPRLYFASEIKALLEVPGIPREIDPHTIPIFLSFLFVPGAETMFKGIRKLEPGQYLAWEEGKIEIRDWFEIAYEPDRSLSEEEWIERLEATFTQATRSQMVSDVPLGAFLSGGLDSSAIVSSMRRAYPDREISCYTMAYDPKDLQRERIVDDFPYAQKVADHLGVTLKSRVIRPEIVNLLPKMVYHLDEPDAGPTTLVTYIVAKLAREDGTTVLLSGTGGDEVLFGYSGHLAYRQYERLDRFPKPVLSAGLNLTAQVGALLQGEQGPIARRARRFERGLRANGLARHMATADRTDSAARESLYAADLVSTLSSEDRFPSCMRRYYEEFQGTGELNRHSHLLNLTFLAAHNFLFNDKCSMATSIETRVPFMDVDLMRFCARIPEEIKLKGTVTKYPLKKAMGPFLPHDAIYRTKTGFAPPLREWVINGLEDVIGECLGPAQIRGRGLFKEGAVAKILEENRVNRADHGYLIYALLNLELWQRTFIDRAGEEITFA
jgi:asparagine synthase (glutamine-hydrolysing)